VHQFFDGENIMQIIFYSSQEYDEKYFMASNKNHNHDIRFVKQKLSRNTVNLIQEENGNLCFC